MAKIIALTINPENGHVKVDISGTTANDALRLHRIFSDALKDDEQLPSSAITPTVD